jgi:hypothetical protein
MASGKKGFLAGLRLFVLVKSGLLNMGPMFGQVNYFVSLLGILFTCYAFYRGKSLFNTFSNGLISGLGISIMLLGSFP